MNESSKLGTCGCPKSLAEATPCEEKTRWCRVAPVDLRSSSPPRLYLALTAALRSVCLGAQHDPPASTQMQTNRSTQHRSESGSSPTRSGKERLCHLLAIWQRHAYAAWPGTRCIDADNITDKSEGAWAAARATIPAYRAKLRQTWLIWRSCWTRITKHEEWPELLG